MTVESVTAAAGTTRPSFYRRFASVAHLQMEVIEMELPIPEFAPTADLAADLTQIDDTVSMVCASHYIRRYGSSLIFLALTDPVLAQRVERAFSRFVPRADLGGIVCRYPAVDRGSARALRGLSL